MGTPYGHVIRFSSGAGLLFENVVSAYHLALDCAVFDERIYGSLHVDAVSVVASDDCGITENGVFAFYFDAALFTEWVDLVFAFSKEATVSIGRGPFRIESETIDSISDAAEDERVPPSCLKLSDVFYGEVFEEVVVAGNAEENAVRLLVVVTIVDFEANAGEVEGVVATREVYGGGLTAESCSVGFLDVVGAGSHGHRVSAIGSVLEQLLDRTDSDFRGLGMAYPQSE